jgi:hypothetical protein
MPGYVKPPRNGFVSGTAEIIPSLSSQVPLTIKGAVSQTANLQEWENSNGDILSRVSSSGVVYGGGLSNVIPTSATVGSGSASVSSNGAISFSGSSSLTVNGCFNSNYQNYKIYFSTTAGTANIELRVQLTSGGVSNAGSYLWQPSGGVGSTVESSFPLTFVQFNGVTANEFSLLQPALAVHTQYVTDWNYDDGGSIIYRKIGGKHRVNTSYDGFVISGITTMTGTVRVYGYNNGS